MAVLKIGLTGGIGSGKSLVSHIFEDLGVPVLNADRLTRRLMENSPDLICALRKRFGNAIYDANGRIIASELSGIVFHDKKALEDLNALTHPPTLLATQHWFDAQNKPYAIQEAALLFESGFNRFMDFVVGVNCPVSLRIQRACKRDGKQREAIEARIKAQMEESKKMSLCNFILVNDEKELLLPQILDLDFKLRQLALTNSGSDFC